MNDDKQLRIGIGKLNNVNRDRSWYVTIYNRELSADRAQGWFATYAEAAAYSRDRLPVWKQGYAK